MKIIQINDIHFGVDSISDEDIYNELEYFIEYVSNDIPDIIVIAGDCFDKRVLIESQANIYFNKFIDRLRKLNTTIIIIHGTESHDRHQIMSLLHYCDENFYIIDKACSLYIKGLNLLILPEEYVKDFNYYEELFNKKYDFCFGHITCKHLSFGQKNKLGHLRRKAFIFDYSMFKNIIKYYVSSGHIHVQNVYKNIIYPGSYSRFSFGEEGFKGFVEYKIDKNKCTYNLIENPHAKLFTSINSEELSDKTEELLIQLRNYSETNDYIRIIVDTDISDEKLNNITGFVKNHQNCCILRKNIDSDKTITEEIEKNMIEKQKELHNRMREYEGLSFIEITQKIAKDKYQEDFDSDYIHKILNTKI